MNTEKSTSPAEDAKNAALRAALAVARQSRGMAAELMRNSEIRVLRDILSATLAGGEAEYWTRVEAELRR